MRLFDDLQSEWQGQKGPEIPELGSREVHGRLKYLRREARTTSWILGATVLGIIGFFSYLQAFTSGVVVLAMGLMTGSLLVRIGFEIYGRRRLRDMDPTLPTTAFQERLFGYYRHRKWVHLVLTPVVLVLYGLGFAILLPDFKASLSPGFYTYILVSGAVFALVLFWLIASQVRREFRLLYALRPAPEDTDPAAS